MFLALILQNRLTLRYIDVLVLNFYSRFFKFHLFFFSFFPYLHNGVFSLQPHYLVLVDIIPYINSDLPTYYIVHFSIGLVPLFSEALIRGETLYLKRFAELDKFEYVDSLELVQFENCSHFLGFVDSVEYDL